MSEIVFNNTRCYSYCHPESKTPTMKTDRQSSSSNLNPVKVLTRMWNSLTKKIDQFQRPSIRQEDVKALGKSFRRSLRINKSAKKKGYEHFYTDEEKR